MVPEYQRPLTGWRGPSFPQEEKGESLVLSLGLCLLTHLPEQP